MERLPAESLNEFYELIRNEGMIKRRLSPNTKGVERVFIIRERAWKSFEEGLYSRFGTGAGVILDGMARQLGVSIASALVESHRSADKVDLLSVIEGYAENAISTGWGVVVVSPPLQPPPVGKFEIRLRIKNCIFCSSRTDGEIGSLNATTSAKPVIGEQQRTCFFVGILAGLADELLRSPHKVSEEKCIPLKDGNTCEISIKEQRAGAPQNRSFI